MSKVTESLCKLLADTYALYLKTQNYHWHVRGPHFKMLHEMFEGLYQDLAAAVDEIAERIIIVGGKAPATFTEFNRLKTLSDGDPSKSSFEMVEELCEDHGKVIDDLKGVIRIAQEANDEGTASLFSDRLSAHEKIRWMLCASRDH